VSTRAYLAYFGVDSDAVGYTTGDYVLQSVSVLYPQIVGLLLGWLALLWGAAIARRLAARHGAPRRQRLVAYTIIAIGALIALRGIVGIAWPTEAIGSQALTPITLATGTVVIVSGYWLWITASSKGVKRTATTAERASLALAAAVVLMALFWIANIFATAYGTNKAELTSAALWLKETGVTLETGHPLRAPKNMIVESTVSSAGPRVRPTATNACGGSQCGVIDGCWSRPDGHPKTATPSSSTSARRIESLPPGYGASPTSQRLIGAAHGSVPRSDHRVEQAMDGGTEAAAVNEPSASPTGPHGSSRRRDRYEEATANRRHSPGTPLSW